VEKNGEAFERRLESARDESDEWYTIANSRVTIRNKGICSMV